MNNSYIKAFYFLSLWLGLVTRSLFKAVVEDCCYDLQWKLGKNDWIVKLSLNKDKKRSGKKHLLPVEFSAESMLQSDRKASASHQMTVYGYISWDYSIFIWIQVKLEKLFRIAKIFSLQRFSTREQ